MQATIRRGGRVHQRLLAVVVVAVVGLLTTGSGAIAGTWDPDAFAKHDVIKLRTNCGSEGQYSFPVWLVVVDRHVFVRLGSRAADRVECTPGMVIGVEIGDQRFDSVRAVASPEMADRVAKAMADKYPSDLLVRWFPHPLTLRLDP